MEKSHIWLGEFPSEDALNTYFEETYDDDDDDAPINGFAADQGERFYDHDWVERGFVAHGSLEQLIVRHSYSKDYIEMVIADAEARGIVEANTFILADQSEFSDPKSVQGNDYTLWYLGIYTCQV